MSKITLDATGRFLSHNELLPVEVGDGFIFHFKVGRVEKISADPGENQWNGEYPERFHGFIPHQGAIIRLITAGE